ncbi:MAG: ArgE/DapE family deacylase [Candidatus Peribacteraceae bacterium]|nr:ArgE/DapE family deacylase [Candidatus Peribacteraceae bacterium]
MQSVYRLSIGEQKLLITTLAKLVAADSSQSETQAIAVCEEFLRKQGIRSKNFSLQKSRPNLVWSLGRGPEILIAAHADTVAPGEGWRTKPFRLTERNGYLIGRGVVDNKSPLAGLLVATKIIKKFESQLKNKIIFAAVADEEQGNRYGMDCLLQKNFFRRLAGAIIPDACGRNREIEIAEKGVLHLRVTVFGKQGHGSLPEQSKNAIFILKDFLRQIRKLKFSKRTKLLAPATVTPTSFHAGAAANVIPGEASATLDIRFPPNEAKQKLLAKIRKLAATESRKWKVPKFKFEILADLPPSETSEYAPIVQSSLTAIKKVSGAKPKIIGMPAFTFGGVLRSRGIPTVAFGPGDLAECHRANEKVRVREVVEFTETLIELLKNL